MIQKGCYSTAPATVVVAATTAAVAVLKSDMLHVEVLVVKINITKTGHTYH